MLDYEKIVPKEKHKKSLKKGKDQKNFDEAIKQKDYTVLEQMLSECTAEDLLVEDDGLPFLYHAINSGSSKMGNTKKHIYCIYLLEAYDFEIDQWACFLRLIKNWE